MTEITFEAGKAIEIAFASIRNGFETQLQEEYFPKVIPLAGEYGGRPIGKFAVEKIPFGHIQCDAMMFFEWPSVDAYVDFTQDARFQPLRPIRDEALAYLNNGNFFSIDETATVSLSQDNAYLLFGAWLDQKNVAHAEVFQENVASEQERIGVKRLARLQHLANSPGPFRPDFVGMTEWPNSEAFQDFLKSDVYKENVHHRDRGTQRFDLFITKV